MTDTPQTDPAEVILKGIPAAPGIAIGPAYRYQRQVLDIEARPISEEEVEPELQRLRGAVARSEKELRKILDFAQQKLGSDSSKILEAQIMILGDDILMKAVERRIRQERTSAEYIVCDEITKYKRMMLAAPDEYMHERAHDVEDVMNRIVRNIQEGRLVSRLEGESVIVSETLTPADTVVFSRNRVLGYATDIGGTTSHAAILSRSLKIPAVVGLRVATRHIHTGDPVAIDGYSGLLIINPTVETVQNLRRKADRFHEFEERLTEMINLSAETRDHRHIELSANIEFAADVEEARRQGAAGIGLFRTEGQILGRGQLPSEEEQYETYRMVADAIHPHPVIIRVFDVGGDKVVAGPYLERNPFLGWRGIRVLLDRQEFFLDQLRAILRASTRRNVRIMLPMISSVGEVRRARQLLRLAQEELRGRGIPFDPDIKTGVMIEVPSAAVMADHIAREADFFSIGTNDLIQYTLAVDRDNDAVAPLFQQFHPAVLQMLKTVITAGHRRNVWVGMCGEMAGDPLATILLVGLGLDEFSVAPAVLPEIKKIIRSVKASEARRIADRALAMESDEEIRAFLIGQTHAFVPDLPLEP